MAKKMKVVVRRKGTLRLPVDILVRFDDDTEETHTWTREAQADSKWWKLPIENFIEPYHVFSCHPWLNNFVTMAECTPPTFDRHVLRCGYEFQKTDPARGEGLPYFPNLPDDKQKSGEWFVLFPNFLRPGIPFRFPIVILTMAPPLSRMY